MEHRVYPDLEDIKVASSLALLSNGALLMATDNKQKWSDLEPKVMNAFKRFTVDQSHIMGDDQVADDFGYLYTRLAKAMAEVKGEEFTGDVVQNPVLEFLLRLKPNLEIEIVDTLGECLWRVAIEEGVKLQHFLDYRKVMMESPLVTMNPVINDIVLEDLENVIAFYAKYGAL